MQIEPRCSHQSRILTALSRSCASQTPSKTMLLSAASCAMHGMQSGGCHAHHANVGTRVELGATLPHDDVARDAQLPAKQLHTEVLGVGVLGILRGAALLLGCKAQLLPLCARRRCTAATAASLGGRRCGTRSATCRLGERNSVSSSPERGAGSVQVTEASCTRLTALGRTLSC